MFAALLMMIIFSGGVANAETGSVDSRGFEAVFGTAVEIRPPTAIVVASTDGLVILSFDSESELKIGSERGSCCRCG